MRLDEKKRLLAIEVSNREFVILEYVRGSSPLKITNITRKRRPQGEPAEVASFLKNLLEEEGFVARKAKVVISGPSIEHRTLTLPPVSEEERELLVKRKLEEEVNLPVSELAISSRVVGSAPSRGVEKDEVLVVSTPAFEIKRVMFTLIEAGVEPLGITSLPVACASLQPPKEKDDYLAFVFVTKDKSFITVSDNLFPRFSREMRIPHQGDEIPEEFENFQSVGEVPSDTMKAVDERVVTELTRSFLYFKQLSRGGSVKKVFLLGDYTSTSMIQLISERLALETDTMSSLLDDRFDLSWVPGDKSEDFDKNRFSYLISLAFETDEDAINLLPPEYRGRRRKFIDRAIIMASSVAFLLVNAFLIIGIISAKNHYRSLLTEMEVQLPALRQNSEFATKIFDLKEQAHLSEMILRELENPFSRWVEYFGSLSQVTPSTLEYDVMNISRDSRGYRVRLEGSVAGMNPQAVQDRFNGFYRALKKNPLLEESRYTPLEILPLENYRLPYEEKFILNFILQKEEG